ncbi:MAG: formate/nitrite transporter family protein [Fusobacteriaceae bacterium]
MKSLNLTEATEFTMNVGIQKTGYPAFKTFLLGLMGGLFVAFGCLGNIISATTLGPLGKFVGALMFPVGIMLVILVGGALFTGNCLVGVAYLNKQITLKAFMKDLAFVWLGNLVGSVFAAFLMANAKVFNPESIETVIYLAHKKTSLPFYSAVASGFLCNVLVAAAVWKSYTAKDTTGKIFSCFFPVMIFAYLGFEHIVANMTYLSLAKFLAPNSYAIMDAITHNLIPVTIGNFLSGGVFLPMIYGGIYHITKSKH